MELDLLAFFIFTLNISLCLNMKHSTKKVSSVSVLNVKQLEEIDIICKVFINYLSKSSYILRILFMYTFTHTSGILIFFFKMMGFSCKYTT